jgi:hypothetical protein
MQIWNGSCAPTSNWKKKSSVRKACRKMKRDTRRGGRSATQRCFANLADSNENERSVPETIGQRSSVFICVARLKKVLIELFRHPVP